MAPLATLVRDAGMRRAYSSHLTDRPHFFQYWNPKDLNGPLSATRCRSHCNGCQRLWARKVLTLNWWNSSILGCVLIGLQPRGGWQVMQRTVQWGRDSLASIFGVTCLEACPLRIFCVQYTNRLEVWDSEAWTSPTEGSQEGAEWKVGKCSQLKRPTKLIDGSRGGQGFICNLLRPPRRWHLYHRRAGTNAVAECHPRGCRINGD